jgi:hypothetical protein
VADDEAADEGSARSSRTSALWADVRIEPVEIALPGGVGYTLRAYRLAAEIERPEIDRESNPDLDDFDVASAAVARRRRVTDEDADDDGDGAVAEEVVAEEPTPRGKAGRKATKAAAKPAAKDDDEDDKDEDDEEFEEPTEEDFAAAEAEDLDEDDEEEDEESDDEEKGDVPVFLARNGRIILFHSPDKLIEFVRSDAVHDLSQLDTWSDFVERVETDDIVPVDDDRYELDLVVENLRGGSDAWDAPLILRAGELARDLGYALRLEAVLIALATGSPLDDLDEALRSAENGGIGSFFARRKLRKIPAQQSSLAWRTVIGKISAVADWRD